MASSQNIKTANDNIPERVAAPQYSSNYGQAEAHKSAFKSSRIQLNNLAEIVEEKSIAQKLKASKSLKLSIGCWVLAVVMVLASFGLNLGTGAKTFAAIALLWTGLWNSYIAADHDLWRFSEVSIVTALSGLMTAIMVSANYLGLTLSITDGLVLMGMLPIVIGYLLSSRICVLASICATLIWGALSFSGLAETSNFVFLIPLICVSQIFVGTKIRSGMSITLAVMTAYYWLINVILTAWSTENLPLTFAAAALFAIGVAHHRAGKATEDKRVTGSSVHIYIGWVAALIGATGFQSFWLWPEALQNSTATLSVTSLNLWKAVIAISLAIIFCSAIIRYKYTQISLAGIFLVTAVSAIIPMMLWFPAWPSAIISAMPGISPVPMVGLLIGAAITASAIGMTLNGVRRHSPVMMGLGMTALLAQGFLLMKPAFITFDNGIIFVAGLLASLAVGATIAGSSLSHQAPAPRFKHS